MKVIALVFTLASVFCVPLFAQAQSSTIRYTDVASSINPKAADSLSPQEMEMLQWVSKGNAYHDNGMYEDAIKCYKKADTFVPGHSLVNYEMGYTYLALKNLDSALYYSKRSLSGEPIESAFSLVGDIYDYKDILDSALKYYDLGLSHFPKSYNLLYNKGVALYVHKRVDEAYKTAKRSISVTRQHEGSYFLMAQISANKSMWIDLFVNGTYANFIGKTKSRMDYVTKYFSELMSVFSERLARFDENVLKRPMLDIHRNWASSTIYRFVDDQPQYGEKGNKLLDSLKSGKDTYEILVKLAIVAMREAVKLPYEFELKPFYRQIVENGYEDVFMRVAFRGVDQVAFDSWRMMNKKRYQSFYDKLAIPFWDGEKSLKAPVLVDFKR